MIKLTSALKSWGTPEFKRALKQDIQLLEKELLPLQQGLTLSSYVGSADINAVILEVSDTAESIIAKTGILYTGIIAGSCCSDDPTPVDEQSEYCELMFNINKSTGETTVSLIED